MPLPVGFRQEEKSVRCHKEEILRFQMTKKWKQKVGDHILQLLTITKSEEEGKKKTEREVMLEINLPGQEPVVPRLKKTIVSSSCSENGQIAFDLKKWEEKA